MEKKEQRKVLRVILMIVGVIVAIAILFVAFHHVYALVEESRYGRPGELVETGHGQMHVFAQQGPEGSPTYVFLDAFGGGSSYYDYNMLWKPLSDDASIITIDYLGYGLSEAAKAERTMENIVEEINTALESTGLPGPYAFVAHSMGGFYSTGYTHAYPEKVQALIMIDNTPTAPVIVGTINQNRPMLEEAIRRQKFLWLTGLSRFFGYTASVPGLTEEEVKAYSFYANKMGQNEALLNEQDNALDNAALIDGIPIPNGIPILMLLAEQNEEMSKSMDWGKTWVGFHEEYLNGHPGSGIQMYNTGHYIHWEAPDEVLSAINTFAVEYLV